jgi:hypothetical protein
MEVSGQTPDLAALLLGKEDVKSLTRRLLGSEVPIDALEKTLLPLTGFYHQTSQLVAKQVHNFPSTWKEFCV